MLKPEFIEMLRQTDAEVFAGLPEALENTAPETSVRINRGKIGVLRELRELGVLGELRADSPVPWSNGSGLYLAERPNFTLMPALHQGLIYVQDASSMALCHIVTRLSQSLGDTPLRLLDACAAPGGKTLCAADSLPEGSLVVANEYDFRRAEILRENVIKWGLPAAVVSRGDTMRFRRLREEFDIVCVDAPCSGEGMMRKDETARSQWSPALVRECAARQDEILGNVWEALRPGGFLVYSTCTFNAVENEEVISRFAADNGAEFVDTGLTEFPGVLPALKGFTGVLAARFLPSRLRGEGIFVSVIRKPGVWSPHPAALPVSGARTKKKDRRQTSPQPDLRTFEPQLKGEPAVFEMAGDSVRALPARHASFIHTLEKELQTIHAGTELATLKGRDTIPSHTLAMSRDLAPGAFPTVELTLADALTYLRREAVTLPSTAPRGYVLLTHAGHPLGFAKNLGSRANNLYPATWRIRNL